MWDVAVIGAGLSGIICARRLVSAGYSVCILDKSRGLGGRMATRRVGEQVRVDHGLRYWQPKSEGLQALTHELVDAGVLKPWEVSEYELRENGVLTQIEPESAPKYVTETGMSAIAKHWLQQPDAKGLPEFEPDQNLLTNRRVLSISALEGHWMVRCETGEIIQAKKCAIAIPAQQAAALLEGGMPNGLSNNIPNNLSKTAHSPHSNDSNPHSTPRSTPTYQQTDAPDLAPDLQTSIKHLKAVSYFPCLTVMAGYKEKYSAQMGTLDPKGWMVSDQVGTSTGWVGLDSSKRTSASGTGPIIVIHSKPDFAQRYLASNDLQPAASVLLRANARKLTDWIAQPEWFQIHRWRYAQIQTPHPEAALAITDTLICGGDWCISPEADPTLSNIDYAYLSGSAMASHLQQRSAASSSAA